ncbi:MAG: serine/threonine-protein kinase, partial [Isosphaeraceae bacterium]
MSSSDLSDPTELLGSSSGELPEPLSGRVLAALEEFKLELRAGQRRTLEVRVANLEGRERAVTLRKLLELEVQHRVEQGEAPALEEYLDRFPGDRSLLVSVFDATARPLVGQGPPRDSRSTERVPGEDQTAPPERKTTLSVEPRGPETAERAEATDSGTLAMDEGVTVAYSSPSTIVDPTPSKIGPYEVIRRLGKGGQGTVYQARDTERDRFVAIKVPNPGVLDDPVRSERFQDEARKASRINHPAIVKVFDLERDDQGHWFIVMEFIEGRPSSTFLKSERVDHRRLAALLATVAEGIHVAHLAGLVHRDLKPTNILIDHDGNPRIVDFGLALHEDAMEAHAGEVAGTVLYMAPEQVRGESHRLDGRTDVWALGVILYQMLTSRFPFRGTTRDKVFDEIRRRAPKPPRQIDESVPRELERICLKCLSRRMAGRYGTAADLASDLRTWLDDEAARDQRPVTVAPGAAIMEVAPRGLRPFVARDHAQFLSLLPGLPGRDGLPEPLQSWKERIEATRAGEAFSVGLIYGPSGSGKSSMILAGLLPSLASHVYPLVIEAAPLATEQRLDRELRKVFRDLPDQKTTVQALKSLRESPALRRGKKVLIVIDQFEQWLQSHWADQNRGLAEMLRQCDGLAIQTLLVVRDDFLMAAMRFMGAVEEPVVEGVNYMGVDRFELEHATGVLERFGRALGRLPATGELSSDQNSFLARAVDGMAESGKVSPARLSLFAEMFRDKEWTSKTLERVGGAEGIGVAFLEAALGDGATEPSRVAHRDAARRVLKALLP